jgi:hypothetical protein
MSRLLFALALVLSTACQGGSSDALDAGDVLPTEDANGGGDDGGTITDAGDAPSISDAAVVPPDANTAYEPVDCRGDDDCTGAMTCAIEVPGGVCTGCSEDAECGDGLRCRFGTCSRQCEDDTDCSPGRECNFPGRCGQRSCNGNNPCPAPFECVGSFNGRCERPACATDGSCPEGFSCLVSEQLCMEP